MGRQALPEAERKKSWSEAERIAYETGKLEAYGVMGKDGKPVDPELATYDAYEVAAILGISRYSAYNLLASGEIKSRVVARSWRCTAKNLKDYLNESVRREDGDSQE